MKHSAERERGGDRARRGSRDPRATANESRSTNLIYGVSPVLEALRAAGRRIDKVMIADGVREIRFKDVIELCRSRGIACNSVPRASIDRLFDMSVNHQGVVAFSAAAEYVDLNALLDRAGDPALILLLDGVEDPRNLGAILRVSECVAADGVVIPERRAVGLNDTVAKSSAGAIEYVRVAKVTNMNRCIDDLKKRNIWVVGTSMDAAINYTEWDWNRPTALVLGGEGGGLHRLVAENCDALVKIPMYGKIDSLNVSVAAGVILFEAKRQRNAS